jgi:hypothetical protein
MCSYCYVCSVLGILFRCVVLRIVCTLMCTVLLPPVVNPIVVNKYIILYHINNIIYIVSYASHHMYVLTYIFYIR